MAESFDLENRCVFNGFKVSFSFWMGVLSGLPRRAVPLLFVSRRRWQRLLRRKSRMPGVLVMPAVTMAAETHLDTTEQFPVRFANSRKDVHVQFHSMEFLRCSAADLCEGRAVLHQDGREGKRSAHRQDRRKDCGQCQTPSEKWTGCTA